ncbi:hypothetical protein GCM10022250_03850 [Flavobacterium chungbukense]|uniref:Uncharacterized protein n=1 Tax=Flavobacterium chungbukense TaxID=877464 RepID=A0ABP7XM16_9FLAO
MKDKITEIAVPIKAGIVMGIIGIIFLNSVVTKCTKRPIIKTNKTSYLTL